MRRIISVAAVIAAVVGAWAGMVPANAQSIPKSIEEGGSDAAIKQRKNQWTVGIAGGLISGTYMRFVDELAKALDDGDNLRVLPIVSYGAASNLDDVASRIRPERALSPPLPGRGGRPRPRPPLRRPRGRGSALP